MTQRTCEKVYPPDLPYDHSVMSLNKALVLIEGAKKSILDGICNDSCSM